MTRLDGFYRWCGFGVARADPPRQAVKGAAYGGSRIAFKLTWRNRLLVLASGKIMVDIAHMMDNPPKVWISNSAFSVLPPNHRMES